MEKIKYNPHMREIKNNQFSRQQSLFPVQTQNLKITKSDSLTKSSYQLSQKEQRLFQLAVAKIDSRKDRNEVIIYSSEYSQAFSVKNPYRDMKQGADSFFERELRIPDEKNNGRYIRTRFVQACDYDPGNGSIRIIFADTMTPHLTELKSKFTSYYLTHIKDFRIASSVRIYEQIRNERGVRKSRNQSEHTFTVKYIRQLLDLENKYSLFSDLRKRVIEATKKDISQHSDLHLDVLYKKEGRNIIEVKYIATLK